MQSPSRLTYLVPYVCGAAGLAVLAWGIFSPIEIESDPLRKTPVVLNPTPPSIPKLVEFGEIWNRRLFKPPEPVVESVSKVAVDTSNDVETVPTLKPNLTLQAILYSEQARMAVFSHDSTREVYRLREGDQKEGIEIRRIWEDRVDVAFQGQPLTIPLVK